MITHATSIWCDDCSTLFEVCIKMSATEMRLLAHGRGWLSINEIDRCPKCSYTLKRIE